MANNVKVTIQRTPNKLREARREAGIVLDSVNSPRFNPRNWARARLALKAQNVPRKVEA